MFDALKNLFGSSSGGGDRVDIKQRFDLMGKSGMGSMSQVHRAKDKKLGKAVCLKVMDKDKTAAFEKRFAGLKKPSEGAISMELRHPNIVQTYEHGLTTKDEPYLVQEWVDGSGLHLLIETNSDQLDGKRNHIIVQVADAVEYMHKHKYLHRDICPRNVIVGPTGAAKLIDFGLTVPYTPEFCKPGNRTGTAQYLAPEIIKRSTTDHRVDCFALGVTAYQTFTGHLPWGDSGSMETFLSHMNSPGTDPREHNADLDEATAKFLMKAIEREKSQRFQTAAQLRDAAKALPRKY